MYLRTTATLSFWGIFIRVAKQLAGYVAQMDGIPILNPWHVLGSERPETELIFDIDTDL